MRSIRKSWIGIVLAILFGLSFFFSEDHNVTQTYLSDNIIAIWYNYSKFIELLK